MQQCQHTLQSTWMLTTYSGNLTAATLQRDRRARAPLAPSPQPHPPQNTGQEKLLRLFEVERPEAEPQQLPGSPAGIRAAVFVGPSDALLVTSAADTPGLFVWDVRSGALVRTLATDGPVTSLDVSGCWRRATAGCRCRCCRGCGCNAAATAALAPAARASPAPAALRACDRRHADAPLPPTLPLAAAWCPLSPPQLTHDGRWLTTADNNSTVRVWDVAALQAPARAFTVPYPVEAASYCPSKGKFAAGGEDMWVHLHSADTGAELEVNKGHHGPVHTVRCGPAALRAGARGVSAAGASGLGAACLTAVATVRACMHETTGAADARADGTIAEPAASCCSRCLRRAQVWSRGQGVCVRL